MLIHRTASSILHHSVPIKTNMEISLLTRFATKIITGLEHLDTLELFSEKRIA